MSTGRVTLGKMSGISHYHAYAKGRNSSALGGSLEQIFLSVSFHIGDRDKIIWEIVKDREAWCAALRGVRHS